MQLTHEIAIAPLPESAAGIPDIAIYIDPQCPRCHDLKEFLRRKHLAYCEHDVMRDNSAQEFLERLDIDEVPVTRVGNEIVVGFDELFLNEIIKTSETAAVNA